MNRFLFLVFASIAFYRFSSVEMALTNSSFVEIEHLDVIVREFGELACFALQLIAKLGVATERHEIAAEANKRALKLNPFMWQPFADLCNYGHKPDPNVYYDIENVENFATCQEDHNAHSFVLMGTDTDCFLTEYPTDNNIYTTPIMDQQMHNAPIQRNSFVSPTFLRSASNASNADADKLIINAAAPNPQQSTTAATTMPANETDPSLVTPFRRQFRYLSNISPSTPSFGWLPLNSPIDNPNNGNRFLSPTAAQAQNNAQPTYCESNEQSKSNNKKLRSNVNYMGNRKETPLQISKPIFSQTGNITPRTQNTLGTQNVRRSSRLFTSSNYSVKENNKSPIINKFAAPRSPPRKTKQRQLSSKINLANTALNEINNEKSQQNKNLSPTMEKEKIETITSANEINNKVLLNNSINNAQNIAQHILNLKKQSVEGLMSLMRSLGEGYVHLSQYNCKVALEAFDTIPKQHYFSSWVQSMIAKAHYENRDYETAAKLFQEVHRKEPNRLQLMEIYSSVLWHLQREVKLSALAQDVMAQDKLSPITWCISGNCFSLHKEHETAIKFFERAVQVDPDFAYSYTLLGHELVITEELDKAMSCFRTAILKDPRHYNAWYGIGSIYSKQERFSLAEFHYKHALEINPQSSVIMVHIGAMQFNLNKTQQALQTLDAAIALDPKNPLPKFHRGSIYFQCGRYKEALVELEQLKQIVPKESVVFYIIGKIHKKLGNVDLALMNFSWATDLDPKGANNQVKDAFDSNTNQSTSVALNVATPDTTEAPSDRSDDSTQLRGINDEPAPDPDGYESDNY